MPAFDPKTFCVLPFMHIEARADSLIAPCCMSTDFVRDEDGHPYTLVKDSLSEAWRSPYMNRLREDLKSGSIVFSAVIVAGPTIEAHIVGRLDWLASLYLAGFGALLVALAARLYVLAQAPTAPTPTAA